MLFLYTDTVSRVLEEEGIISQELVDAISDENLEVPLMDMSVLDVAPQEYKIDNNLQADPEILEELNSIAAINSVVAIDIFLFFS